MSTFEDRQSAGQRLTFQLLDFDEASDAVVIGLPRGGVVVAAEVARNLHLPFEVIMVKKLGSPLNLEFAIGAVAELGVCFLDWNIIYEHQIPCAYWEEEVSIRRHDLDQQVYEYRRGKLPPDFYGRIVIIIDDGIATGATMRAAIATVRKLHARRIVVGVPVISEQALDALLGEVDRVAYLAVMRAHSFSVGEHYESFPEVHDDAVRRVLRDVHKFVPRVHRVSIKRHVVAR